MESLKKQIVFSDYDGTIYIKELDMPNNIKAIKKYRNLKGKFVIVTGRSKKSISNVIEKYNIEYDYIICNNGSSLYDNLGNKIYEQTIKNDISEKIIKYVNTKNIIELSLYDDEDKVEYKNQELQKIRIKVNDNNMALQIENEINSLFGVNVRAHSNFPSMYYSNINFAVIDIVSIKAGKESTIKELLKMLKIEDDKVLTVGDGRNDIEMIKKYNGYSMITAEEEVKQVASKIFENMAEILNHC